MTSSVRVFLEGVPLTDVSSIQWALSEGVGPFTTRITVPVAQFNQIISSARGKGKSNPFLSLVFISQTGSGGDENITFTNVYMTGFDQAPDPRFRVIKLADSRVFWNRSYFKGDFNIRGRLGNRIPLRFGDDGPTLQVPLVFTDEVQFRTYSLFPPIRDRDGNTEVRAWTVKEIVRQIIGKINDDMPFVVRIGNDSALDSADEVLQEDIRLDSPSDGALAEVLNLVPNIGMFLGNDNDIFFFEKNDGSEINIINQMGVPQEVSGQPLFVENDLFTPEGIDILFEAEMELRFNFEDLGDGTAPSNPKEGRFMTTVIPIPDPEITLPNGETALQNQYVDFDTYLTVLDSFEGLDSARDVDEAFLREYLLNGLLDFNWAQLGTLEFRASWQARIGALQSHYRKTFQINKFYLNRMINIKTNLLRTIDPTTGAQSPSPVFLDYGKRLTNRGNLSDGSQFFLVNVDGFADEGEFIEDKKIADATACPWAFVSLSDSEAKGILGISFQSDPYGLIETIYPSKIENPPSFKLGDDDQPHFLDEATKNDPTQLAGLQEKHKLATIITATPAPSSAIKLFQISFTPNDMPSNLSSRLTNARGPRWKVKISPSLQTARFVWDDNLENEIDEAFGIGVNPGGEFIEIEPNFEGLEGLLLNREHLENLALATAQSFYQKFVDRFRGTFASEFNGAFGPSGTVFNIVHNVGVDGHPTTRITFAEDLIGPNFIQLMKREHRAFIQRHVKQEGGSS